MTDVLGLYPSSKVKKFRPIESQHYGACSSKVIEDAKHGQRIERL